MALPQIKFAALRAINLPARMAPKIDLVDSVLDSLRAATAYVDAFAVTRGGAAAWRARRDERLAALLRHAHEHSPFYRRLYRALLGARPPSAWRLDELPPVHKAELMQHFDEWVTDPAVTVEGVREFVRDPARIGTPFLGRYIVWESSGSSGRPALFVQDREALAVGDALQSARGPVASALPSWLTPMWSAFGPMLPRLAFVGAVGGHFASVVSLARLVRVNPWLQGALRTFSFLQPRHELAAALEAWQPSILSTYPSMAWVLAEERAASRLRIAPREIWTGGESLTPALRAALSERFGATVRDSYGASECLEMASECGHGGMHLHGDWVILEPVDECLRPVPEGELGASVLLTNLANRVQPVIRYVLGDRVRIVRDPCACGSALPIVEVHGRDDETLGVDVRAGERVHLAPLALVTVLEDEARVFDFELCQTAPATLRLTLYGCDARPERVAAARTALQGWLRQQGLGAVRLQCGVCTDGEARGRSGKRLRVRALRA